MVLFAEFNEPHVNMSCNIADRVAMAAQANRASIMHLASVAESLPDTSPFSTAARSTCFLGVSGRAWIGLEGGFC